MTGSLKGLVLLGLVGVAPACGTDAPDEAAAVRLTAEPDHIRIGTFYHGTNVRVTADLPPCDGVVVKMEGKDQEVTLNKRGRVFGIWLNVARVTVRNAPQAYVIAASATLESICSKQEREELGLGFDALRSRISFSSDEPLTGSEFDEFLNLKRHSDTYAVSTDIHLTPAHAGRQEVSAVLPVASAIPCGEYTVRIYCFEHGSLLEDAATQISIESVGLPRLIAALAVDHAAAHGLLAICAALAAGSAMGVIFHSRTRRRK